MMSKDREQEVLYRLLSNSIKDTEKILRVLLLRSRKIRENAVKLESYILDHETYILLDKEDIETLKKKINKIKLDSNKYNILNIKAGKELKELIKQETSRKEKGRKRTAKELAEEFEGTLYIKNRKEIVYPKDLIINVKELGDYLTKKKDGAGLRPLKESRLEILKSEVFTVGEIYVTIIKNTKEIELNELRIKGIIDEALDS